LWNALPLLFLDSLADSFIIVVVTYGAIAGYSYEVEIAGSKVTIPLYNPLVSYSNQKRFIFPKLVSSRGP
jgi:hypothetical protein